jgi:hypothetical protein
MVLAMIKLSALLLVGVSLFMSESDAPRGDAPAPILVELLRLRVARVVLRLTRCCSNSIDRP